MGTMAMRSAWDDEERPMVRRASTLALVLALHLAIVLLVTLAPVARRVVIENSPFLVKLLPIDREPAPALPVPPARAGAQPATPAPAKPVEVQPISPSLAPKPLPRPVDVRPVALPAPVPANGSGDIVIGGGRSALPGLQPPRWVRTLTDDEFFPLMDEDLWRVPMDVTFRLRCLVAADTRIDCRILSESPTIPGVRKAVLRGLPLLRMRPPMRDGRPLIDQPVEFEWRVGVHSRFSALGG
ncbi:MAG: hypothetical protein B7Y47_06190 [Sphingomonas sp. 28-63-12]|nr:MAG: hypothetical protein B7Y47_06190 [Sphingomonas sp. 28-63-12]